MVLKLSVSVLAGISWMAVSLMVLLNPSGTLAKYDTSTMVDIILWAGIPVGLSAFFFLMFRCTKKTLFFLLLCVLLVFLATAVFWAASVSHRDYHTILFQFQLLLVSAMLLQLPEFGIVRDRKKIYRALVTATFAVFFAFSVWLIFMGYAIVTRTEPRWIEATVYNFVGALILLVMLFSAVALRHKAYRILYLNNQEIIWEDRVISNELTGKEKEVLLLYLQNLESCNCAQLTAAISSRTPESCRECHENGYSAIDCTAFRQAKKYTAALKRVLELLGAGTIVPVSDNYREIKQKGWRIRFFDDVLFHRSKR